MLGFLYSWRAVRLKALPVIDVITHALMLSSLLFLAGYLLVDAVAGPGVAGRGSGGIGIRLRAAL